MKQGEIEISFASNLDYLELVEEVSHRVTQMAGFDEDARHWIGLSVRESVINAIQHGNRGDESKKVEMSFQVSPDRLLILVRDQGEGFDATNLPNPSDEENLLKTNGRGIFCIRSFMDQVDFRRLPRGGVELRMEKSRNHSRERMMKIEAREVQGVTILDVSGKITIGEGSVEVRNQVSKLLKQGKKRLVLNLAAVPYVDSSGLGALVSSHTTAAKEGGQLKLAHLTEKIRHLLVITKLLTVFRCYDTEQEAIASFSNGDES